MNNRLETLPWAAVAVLKQEARLPCGLFDLIPRMINEVPGNPSSGPLVRD